jgi:hypothetical protein
MLIHPEKKVFFQLEKKRGGKLQTHAFYLLLPHQKGLYLLSILTVRDFFPILDGQ